MLEIVNLLIIGLTSFNVKQQVPNDIPAHNQYIPARNLKSQGWLDEINCWTKNQKMLLNEKKTKTMIFNHTNNYQFTTRLTANDKPIEVINSTRLLGTIVTSDLKWDENTAHIVKKANARMELLRKVASFGTGIEDLKIIYFLFVRSQLEQSAVVWHSSLTEENKGDLERVQKSALKIILGEKYQGYQKALAQLGMDTLDDRRNYLCLKFAIKSSKHEKAKEMFPLSEKNHQMNTRNNEKFNVQFANTSRLQNSSIIFMQNMLNEYEASH